MMRPAILTDLDLPGHPGRDVNWSCQLARALSGGQVRADEEESGATKCFDTVAEHLQLVFTINEGVYHTDAGLLAHTRITAFDREKLKSWLLSETQNLYCRETYATASRFLDMFFMHRCNVLKSQFQLLGLACLVLASKIVESRIPAISFQIFNKDKILNFEKLLMKVFSYKLNPITYIHVAEAMLSYWDAYLNKSPLFKHALYFKDSKNGILGARAIFETLDCLDLVTESLNIPVTDLVGCTFYVEHRRACLLACRNKLGPFRVQDAEFANFHSIYQRTMFKFFEDLKANIPLFRKLTIQERTISYVFQFSRPDSKIELTSYKKFRQEILRQTYNEQISQKAKKFLRKAI